MTQAAPDWTLLQAFLAVADAGSLSAAARATRQSQPTMGRHIKQLEAQLGIALFRRIPSGLEPTEAALPLVEVARSMAESAARLTRMAEGRQEGLRGTVRITASRILSQYTLPPILARLRIAEPEIQIELVPSDTSENLLFREADIALRMYRPEQLDIIARHIADLPIGLYAAKSYLQRRGTPRSAEDLIDHDFIGYDRDERILRLMRATGFEVSRDFFALRCDDQTVYWELTRAGCGIGGSQVTVAEDDPLLERVLPDLELPALPLWLAAPQALRRNPRIRRVWDFLAEALGD
ncbi:LysR family transcriptional regulator [Pararhodobacter oceanensis]|uniref:LysR family transcriptional regulator n=1 Tax=Pararhodobacter oceanensis TaxID=2172121 RepID=UPI003A8FCF20